MLTTPETEALPDNRLSRCTIRMSVLLGLEKGEGGQGRRSIRTTGGAHEVRVRWEGGGAVPAIITWTLTAMNRYSTSPRYFCVGARRRGGNGERVETEGGL